VKNSKAVVAVLVLIIIVALAFLVYKIATGRSKSEVKTDETGRPLDVPPEMIPKEHGGTAPEVPDTSTD
jgi:uncharacterized membrane protein